METSMFFNKVLKIMKTNELYLLPQFAFSYRCLNVFSYIPPLAQFLSLSIFYVYNKNDVAHDSLCSCADTSSVKPNLFVLSPLLPKDWVGEPEDLPPEACLAAGFRPKDGEMILNVNNGSLSVNTSNAVMSKEMKSYFFAGFTNKTIYSCELHDSMSNNENGMFH